MWGAGPAPRWSVRGWFTLVGRENPQGPPLLRLICAPRFTWRGTAAAVCVVFSDDLAALISPLCACVPARMRACTSVRECGCRFSFVIPSA